MKITRLKRGYRIRLSDSEFAALSDVFTRGQGEVEGMEQHEYENLESDVKRGLRSMTEPGSWFVEDKRA